ncbi:TATA-binding protein-associated factor mot1 [Malassezia psittaci]|uniref:TATA-binding protein-associated factor mot1 n=1 Tax=Malassezia psittaci TaxID=1821823 RepID=A0AAF0F5I3_9BASI|nr:TATA-binding protein-associated factor mot1 [Malassezia psittaci]
MGSPATRLDRLVSLLDIGSTQAIRSTAAVQLGQIAALRVRGSSLSDTSIPTAKDPQPTATDYKTEPSAQDTPNCSVDSPWESHGRVDGEWSEVTSLLARIVPLLLSKSWETRNAAAQALCQICRAANVWDPYSSQPVDSSLKSEEPSLVTEDSLSNALSFEDFSLSQLLSAGTKLLASAGKEYDVPDLLSRERLQHAKKDLLGKLGLGFGAEDIDVGLDIDSEMHLAQKGAEKRSPSLSQASSKPPPKIQVDDVDDRQLSARERNQLKRKRKNEAKQSSSHGRPGQSSPLSLMSGNAATSPIEQQKRVKIEGEVDASSSQSNDTSTESKFRSLESPPNQWPFRTLAELLSLELFSPTWESRHGAALGLRELFRTQGSGGGQQAGLSREQNKIRHARWAEDLAVRLLCVFALDRLGDFVLDQVVAPVRETASQTLAQLLPHMTTDLVRCTHKVLLEMIRQGSPAVNSESGLDSTSPRRSDYVWEVRHAGLLGLKYEVAVRQDLLRSEDPTLGSDMLEDVLEITMLGLRDDDDDVRAVAAATLLPITEELVEQRLDRIPALMDQLWWCISDMKDDLSSSTGSVMDLLASLFGYPQVMTTMQARTGEHALANLIPRLYLFFRHTITSVRLSVLNAMRAFLRADAAECSWLDEKLVRLLFQNMIVEERAAIRDATAQVWSQVLEILAQQSDRFASCVLPYLSTLFQIVMMPIGEPIDYRLFYKPAQTSAGARIEHDVDKGILSQDLTLVGIDTVIRGRLGAATALGEVLAKVPLAEQEACPMLQTYLASTSALQKCLASVVLQRWAELVPNCVEYLASHTQLAEVHQSLTSLLDATMPATYAEMNVMLTRMQHDCQTLLNMFVRDGRLSKGKVPKLPMSSDGFTLENANLVVHTIYSQLEANLSPKVRESASKPLQDQRRKILTGLERYQTTKETEDILVLSAVATAVIAWKVLPEKLNPVIRNIMNSVKYEENLDLQLRSAKAVAQFLELCSEPNARANPSPKIVKNLCAFVCQDTVFTAVFSEAKSHTHQIYSLASTEEPRKPSGKSKYADLASMEDPGMKVSRLIRRGADAALQQVCLQFGDELWDRVPWLWTYSAQPILDRFSSEKESSSRNSWTDQDGQAILDACSILQTIVPHMAKSLHESLQRLLPALVIMIQNDLAVIRAAGAECFSVLTRSVTDASMHTLIETVVPLLGDTSSVVHRQGAIETLAYTVRSLDDRLLPYVIFLVVPVLGRMSDSNQDVRLLATNTFAELVKLVPLIQGLEDPPGFPQKLLERRRSEEEFLAQLLDGNKVQPYQLPISMNVDLRKYQMEGVSWMAFLAKYQLHGILCDDMGLGKTLQSITLLSCKHYERNQRWESSQAPDSKPIPSLVVCPPTLTGHWVHETQQYSKNLRPLLYAGHPTERARLLKQIQKYDVVIMSYDVVRNDIASLAPLSWYYCILDEGHVISSAKTKTTKGVKQIQAQHRLILSGTPIQNNALELWSLFDFLMPGFLGTDHAFYERYAKPVLACRSGKPSAAEQEAATLALEALHKQITPFLLRRLKEDVLDDLPPKIIQDVECDLGDIQKQLYDDFVKSQARNQVEEELDASESSDHQAKQPKQHVFQTLQYLRKLANHPSLVLNRNVGSQQKLLDTIDKQRGTLQGLAHAPKLAALRQLLLDCGIGKETTADNESILATACTEGPAVSQHRVLIFCQMKQMLDVIEKDLLKTLMPSVTYLRLDGSVSHDKRHGIVQSFNSDPSIDVLLLTTSVGGLGLTLTGADTVIFVEHDWNPMKDLQAMDRAHRLGQKKVVNVYRLITRNTLEAKIMGLQAFKMNVANSVVTQQNKGMDMMGTDRILDLFGTDSDASHSSSAATSQSQANGKAKGISQKALLASLEQMPDVQEEYESLTNWTP